MLPSGEIAYIETQSHDQRQIKLSLFYKEQVSFANEIQILTPPVTFFSLSLSLSETDTTSVAGIGWGKRSSSPCRRARHSLPLQPLQ